MWLIINNCLFFQFSSWIFIDFSHFLEILIERKNHKFIWKIFIAFSNRGHLENHKRKFSRRIFFSIFQQIIILNILGKKIINQNNEMRMALIHRIFNKSIPLIKFSNWESCPNHRNKILIKFSESEFFNAKK